MNEIKKKVWAASEIEYVLVEAKDIITSSIIEDGLVDDNYEGELDVLDF